MNPLLAIGLIGAGVIVLSKLQTKDTADRLHFILNKISADFQTAFTVQVNIDIGIQNATSSSFVIKSMSGDLYVNDHYVGNVSNFTATQIAANSETAYRVSVQLNTLSLPTSILSLIKNFSGVTVKIDSTINVDDIPVNKTLEKVF